MNEIKKLDAHNDDNNEVNVALDAAKDAQGGYTHKFKKPFTFEDKEYSEIYFDFSRLKGRDLSAIERELNVTQGVSVIRPQYSIPFLTIMLARSAGVGSDMIRALPMKHANHLYSKAREYLTEVNPDDIALTFNYEDLTANDLIEIDQELIRVQKINIIKPEISGPFLLAMSARAAGVKSDVIENLPMKHANYIRGKAMDFLTDMES